MCVERVTANLVGPCEIAAVPAWQDDRRMERFPESKDAAAVDRPIRLNGGLGCMGSLDAWTLCSVRFAVHDATAVLLPPIDCTAPLLIPFPGGNGTQFKLQRPKRLRLLRPKRLTFNVSTFIRSEWRV